MASSAPTPLVARGTTHTTSATTAAITTIAAIASTTFSRLRGCMVLLAPCTAPPTCISVPPSRRLSARASVYRAPTARVISLSGEVLYQIHHTLLGDRCITQMYCFLLTQ